MRLEISRGIAICVVYSDAFLVLRQKEKKKTEISTELPAQTHPDETNGARCVSHSSKEQIGSYQFSLVFNYGRHFLIPLF